MNTKKITIIAIFIFAVIYADSAVAQQWTPLVRIPGLPATGPVNLSMYLVGLYNFLLSIVGIVAVMMLIVGGMRYITAVGNASAIGDAKDIIQNAIVGLLLALLSWVFIATINPDVLYIKKPNLVGSSAQGVCHISYDIGSDTCICRGDPSAIPIIPPSSPTVPAPYLSAEACDQACKDSNLCGLPVASPCIANGSPYNSSSTNYKLAPYNSRCQCIDDAFISIGASATCQDACADPANYHGINWDLRVGHSVDGVSSVNNETENFSVIVNKPVYFDFSNIRDCNDNLVHYAIKFDGPPVFLSIIPIEWPDKWCCMDWNPACSSTWGECCNGNGSGCAWTGFVPACNSSAGSDLYDSPTFPIYVHTFITASPSEDDPEDVWVGVSIKFDGTCTVNCACDDDFKKIFQVRVDPA